MLFLFPAHGENKNQEREGSVSWTIITDTSQDAIPDMKGKYLFPPLGWTPILYWIIQRPSTSGSCPAKEVMLNGHVC